MRAGESLWPVSGTYLLGEDEVRVPMSTDGRHDTNIQNFATHRLYCRPGTERCQDVARNKFSRWLATSMRVLKSRASFSISGQDRATEKLKSFVFEAECNLW